jgi:hypothetical protein
MYSSQLDQSHRPRGRSRVGEGAVCHLITTPVRLLMTRTSIISLRKLPGPRAIGKEPKPCTLEVLWALAYLP